MKTYTAQLALIITIALAAACGSKTSPVRSRPSAPGPGPPPPVTQPAPRNPTPITEAAPALPRVSDEAVNSASLDDLNLNSPLKSVFFGLDSSDIDPTAKAALDDNAAVLKQHPTWGVTIEGH